MFIQKTVVYLTELNSKNVNMETAQQTGLFWFRKLSQPEHESFIQNFIDYGKTENDAPHMCSFSKYLKQPCESMADFFSGAFPLAESPEGAEFWENVAQKHK